MVKRAGAARPPRNTVSRNAGRSARRKLRAARPPARSLEGVRVEREEEVQARTPNGGLYVSPARRIAGGGAVLAAVRRRYRRPRFSARTAAWRFSTGPSATTSPMRTRSTSTASIPFGDARPSAKPQPSQSLCPPGEAGRRQSLSPLRSTRANRRTTSRGSSSQRSPRFCSACSPFSGSGASPGRRRGDQNDQAGTAIDSACGDRLVGKAGIPVISCWP